MNEDYVTLKCKNPECMCAFEVDVDLVQEEFIQCPFCFNITKNPLRRK